MSKEEACFIHNGEIYYRIGASEKEIDNDLQRMVGDSIYEDFNEESKIQIKAQIYLIYRQTHKIKNKYCE